MLCSAHTGALSWRADERGRRGNICRLCHGIRHWSSSITSAVCLLAVISFHAVVLPLLFIVQQQGCEIEPITVFPVQNACVQRLCVSTC